MSHFAKVKKGIVTNVIVAEQDFIDTYVDDEPGEWIKCSYNMSGGIHWDMNTRTPSPDQSIIEGDEARMRKNFPGVGYVYDKEADVFYEPQPHPSWTLDTDGRDGNPSTYYWWAPYEQPEDAETYDSDGNFIVYDWDEEAHQADGVSGWKRILT